MIPLAAPQLEIIELYVPSTERACHYESPSLATVSTNQGPFSTHCPKGHHEREEKGGLGAKEGKIRHSTCHAWISRVPLKTKKAKKQKRTESDTRANACAAPAPYVLCVGSLGGESCALPLLRVSFAIVPCYCCWKMAGRAFLLTPRLGVAPVAAGPTYTWPPPPKRRTAALKRGQQGREGKEDEAHSTRSTHSAHSAATNKHPPKYPAAPPTWYYLIQCQLVVSVVLGVASDEWPVGRGQAHA